MDDAEFDLQTLVKVAGGLSGRRKAAFMQLLPPRLHPLVVQLLRAEAEAATVDDEPGKNDEMATEVTGFASDSPDPAVRTTKSSPDESTPDESTVDDGTVVESDEYAGAGQAEKSSPVELTVNDDTVIESDEYVDTEFTLGAAQDHRQSAKKENAMEGGRIRLIRPHAYGSIGEVYVAYDDHLAREVALKRIRSKWAKSKRRVTRFIREAVITAQLQHPGIVPVYDIAIDDQESHYTMPLVQGVTLADAINEAYQEVGKQGSAERWMQKIRPLLNHFIGVCNAIDYANDHDVIHRDLKPSNIMIGDQGQTLVLDWGCAKRVSDPDDLSQGFDDVEHASPDVDMTIEGTVMGTIPFMSPEQAAGHMSKLGPATDIFSLGATLFNVLTKDIAIRSDGKNMDADLERVRQGDFLRVEDVEPRAPSPLAAICQKAMQVRPDNRYQTAGDLGRDIAAFLAGEPVAAYSEPIFNRLKRFIKRHQTMATTVLGMLVVGLVSLTILTAMIENQRGVLTHTNGQLGELNEDLATSIGKQKQLTTNAIDREEAIKRILYSTQMLISSQASTQPGGIGRLRQLINNWRAPEFDHLRGWEWRHLDSLTRREQWGIGINGTVDDVLFVRDQPLGKIFIASESTVVTISPSEGQVVKKQVLPYDITAIDSGPRHELLALGLRDGRVIVINPDDPTVEPVEFEGHESAITDLRWNLDGDYLATCDQAGELRVWHWYERVLKGSGSDVLNHLGKHHMTWSYDGKQIAWTTGTEVRQLTVETKSEEVIARDSWIASPCWSHEGNLLAYIGPENSVVVVNFPLDATTRFDGHQLFVESLQWHPHQHFLASASADASIRIWDGDTRKEVRQLVGHTGPVYTAAWTPDGRQLVSGGLPEDALRVWDMTDLGSEAFDRELQDRPALSWHPDGQQLAVAENRSILIQDERGETKRLNRDPSDAEEIFGLAFDTTGDQIACVSGKGRVWTVDADSGEVLKVYDEGGETVSYPNITGKGVAWSPDGSYVSGIGAGGKTHVWDVKTGADVAGTIEHDGAALVVAWSPANQGKSVRLAFAGTGDHVQLFDAMLGKVTMRMNQPGWKTALAWSPDGTMIAIGDRRQIVIRNVDSGLVVAQCDGPSAMVIDVSWSRSQNRIAALTQDGQVSLWNTNDWSYCANFDLHGSIPYSLQWTPDGEQLVSAARHGRLVFQRIQPRTISSDSNRIHEPSVD